MTAYIRKDLNSFSGGVTSYNTAQVATAISGTMLFDAQSVDTHGFADSAAAKDTITVPAGTYQVSLQVTGTTGGATTTASYLEVGIESGASLLKTFFRATAGAEVLVASVVGTISVAASTVLVARWAMNASTLAFDVNDEACVFSVVRVA